MYEFTPSSRRLIANLESHRLSNLSKSKPDTIHVSGVASTLYFAYEQLRNAANYTHHHLLLRSAIERYLRRNVYLPHNSSRKIKIGEDLIIELHHARYIKNDTIPRAKIEEIDNFVNNYAQFYNQIIDQTRVTNRKASKWMYQVLSTSIEKMVSPKPTVDFFVDFAFHHYYDSVEASAFGMTKKQLRPFLYFAVHRTIMNSDMATARIYWLRLNWEKVQNAQAFADECRVVDEYFEHKITNKLCRLINRYGAPMKVLRQMIITDENFVWLAERRKQLLSKVDEKLHIQYSEVQDRLISGIVKAVIFIFITKVIIGLAVEIPYDLSTFGQIHILPLVINLFLPSLYMASAVFSARQPSLRNTKEVRSFAERIIYETDHPVVYKTKKRKISSNLNITFNIVYAIAFIISLGLLTLALMKIDFTWVHIAIFFFFLSGVSFLRFRLIRGSREFELVGRSQTLFGVVADFFYTPFIHLGHWLSDRYQRLNLVTFFLDIAIEAPLKTVLRIIRQWVGFVSDKREEI